MNTVLVLLLAAVAVYLVWKSYEGGSFDLKKGAAAVAAAAVAAWAYLHDLVGSLIGQ